MATIRAYTTIEQSKKLAEILPLKSADMHYWLAWSGDVSEERRNTPEVGTPNKDAIKTYWCPCWSLATLLAVLPSPLHLNKRENINGIVYWYSDTDDYDNPVDACYELILKLHKLKML